MSLEPKKSGYVFVNPKNGKPYTSIKTAFNNALQRANIIDFRFPYSTGFPIIFAKLYVNFETPKILKKKRAQMRSPASIATFQHRMARYMADTDVPCVKTPDTGNMFIGT